MREELAKLEELVYSGKAVWSKTGKKVKIREWEEFKEDLFDGIDPNAFGLDIPISIEDYKEGK